MIVTQTPKWFVNMFTFLALIFVLHLTFLICISALFFKIGSKILKLFKG